MNKKILAICDEEKKYLYKLQEILEERESFPFEISTYTDVNLLIKEEKKKGISVIIISDQLYENVMSEAFANKLVILLDSGRGLSGSYCKIWKYQSGESIRKEILRLFSEYKSDGEEVVLSGALNIQGKRETKLIGIFSPVRRCLKTSFSIILGEQLSVNAPTLYINFQSFAGLKEELECGEGKELTDLIYFMNGGAKRLIYKLEELVCTRNSMDYIGTASSFIDICGVGKDEWIKFLEIVKAYGSYEYIILDLSEIVSGLMDILRLCSQVITITKPEKQEMTKISEYEETVRKMEYEDVLNKTLKVELPAMKHFYSDLSEMRHSELSDFISEMIREELNIEF